MRSPEQALKLELKDEKKNSMEILQERDRKGVVVHLYVTTRINDPVTHAGRDMTWT
jgi:hypothetical protein